jgi:hypothetical protein
MQRAGRGFSHQVRPTTEEEDQNQHRSFDAVHAPKVIAAFKPDRDRGETLALDTICYTPALPGKPNSIHPVREVVHIPLPALQPFKNRAEGIGKGTDVFKRSVSFDARTGIF